MSGDKSISPTSEYSLSAEISAGVKESLPVLAAVIPFGALFGALAVESGLTLTTTMMASATIFAGASQYAMIDLMGQGISPWSIVLAVFAINFRHVLYSASLGRYLSRFSRLQRFGAFFFLMDPLFAAASARKQRVELRPAFYFSYGGFVYLTWLSSNLIGALFGGLLDHPERFGIDFILPLYFTGLVAGFRGRPNFWPVLTSSVVVSLGAYFTVGSPWHITLGGLAGLVVAAILSQPGQRVLNAE